MNFYDELQWRGMLHDATPGAKEALEEGRVTGYIGFDPTAPSLTIGNYVQVMLLSMFQKSGHQPIVLMGGATGRIGDPSGKDKERLLKSEEELDANLNRQLGQLRNMLDFEGPNKALIVNNYDFYKDMNVLEFLRKVGKTLTVSYMMSKDSVKNRLETGLSYTEFSYQLLQAYDFQCLYEKYGCTMQMGGSDQWGNITAGTEFIRRNTEDGKVYAMTTPLLTRADGKKFGKSEEGNIWMDGKMTSPYKFYQFWINADDADIPKFIRYFTFKTKEQVLAEEKEFEPRVLKQLLAEELTRRIHSDESYESVLAVTNMLFNKKASSEQLKGLSTDALKTISEEIPSFVVPMDVMTNEVNVIDVLCDHAPIFQSKGEARRAIQNNALSINKEKVDAIHLSFESGMMLKDQYIMVENGKKNKYMLVLK